MDVPLVFTNFSGSYPIYLLTFIFDLTYPQQIQGSEFYLLKFYINCLFFIKLHDRHVKGTHSEKFQPIQVCCTVPRTLNQDIENQSFTVFDLIGSKYYKLFSTNGIFLL